MFFSVITKNSDWKILTKKFNFMGRGGGVTKKQSTGGLPKKGGLDSLQIYGLGKKERWWCFWLGTPCKWEWSLAQFQYILIVLNLAYNKNKLGKILYYWSEEMLNFDFLDKGLGIASPSHFVSDCSRKMFLILYSINWPNFIVWLPLLLEILGNVYCSYLFPMLWRHKFWNWPFLSN